MIYSNQNSIPFDRGCFLFLQGGGLIPPSFYYIRSMKKLLLFPLLFLVFACTSDEMDQDSGIQNSLFEKLELLPMAGCASKSSKT